MPDQKIDFARFDHVSTIRTLAAGSEPAPEIHITRYGVVTDEHYRNGLYPIGDHGEVPDQEPWVQGLPEKALMHDWRSVMIGSRYESMLADKILRQDDTQAADWRVNIQLDGLPHLSVMPVGARVCIFDDDDNQVCQLLLSARNSPCMNTGKPMFETCGTDLSRHDFKKAFLHDCQHLRGVMTFLLWPAQDRQVATIKVGYRVGIQERF